jgi:hypothetical protein
MLKQYEEQQAALQAARDAEERRRQELEQQQQREFEQRQREQAEAQRLAQEQLLQQQMLYSNQAAQHQASELERELLAMRGQYERDQIFLEQYDRVRLSHAFFRVGLMCIETASKSSGSGASWCQRPHQFANNVKR